MKTNLSLLFVVSLLFVACGDKPDSGSGKTAVNAIAVDGYVLRGNVYLDLDGNGKMDIPYEKSKVLTDAYGHIGNGKKLDVTTTPSTVVDKDHCAPNVDGNVDESCFYIPGGVTTPVVRVENGYNGMISDYSFGGMSTKLNLGSISYGSKVVISPVTTLMTYLSDPSTFIANEGLTETEMRSDQLEFADTTTLTVANRLKLIKLNLLLHKSADVIFNSINPLYGSKFGKDGDIHADSHYVYKALAANITSGVTVDTMLGTSATIQKIVGDVITEMNTVATANSIALPLAADVTAKKGSVDAKIIKLRSLINALLTSALTASTDKGKADATGKIRAIEILSYLLRTRDAATDAGVSGAYTAATNTTDGTAYIGFLSQPTFGFRAAVKLFECLQPPGCAPAYVNANSVDFNGRAPLNGAVSLVGGTSSLNFKFNSEGTVSITGTMDAGGTTMAYTDAAPLGGTYTAIDPYTNVVTVEPIPGVKQTFVVSSNPGGGYTADTGGQMITY